MIAHESTQVRKPGKRAAYVVTELRGATAHYQPAEDSARTFKTGATDLANNLRIGVAELVGCRFSSWAEPAEYGVQRFVRSPK